MLVTRRVLEAIDAAATKILPDWAQDRLGSQDYSDMRRMIAEGRGCWVVNDLDIQILGKKEFEYFYTKIG